MTRDQLIAEKNRELAWFKSRCADLESQLEAGRRINYEKETRCAELEAELNQLKTCEYVPRSMYKQLKAENAALLKKLDTDYPSELFWELIHRNSPYAFYIFQWVPYQSDAKRWRLKMLHDVKTFDGREAHGIWPNGSSCGPFTDEEVEFIRISKKQHGAEWQDPRETPPQQPAPGGEHE